MEFKVQRKPWGLLFLLEKMREIPSIYLQVIYKCTFNKSHFVK